MEISYQFKNLRQEYEKAYLTCHLHKETEKQVREVSKQMLNLRSIYESVEDVAGVPWWFAGILHYLEWSFREPERFEKEVSKVLVAKKFNQAKTKTLASYLWGFDLWNGFRDGAGDESEWVWSGTNIIKGTRESDSSSGKVGAGAIVWYLKSTKAIDIPSPEGAVTLKILQDTIFKTSTKDSEELSEGEKMQVSAGTKIQIIEDEPIDDLGNHMRVLIPDGILPGQNDRNEWYFYKGHVELEGTDKDNKPNDKFLEPVTKIKEPPKGKPIKIPKLGTVYLGEPILPNGHFSWAEATKNGTRIPVSSEIVDGIMKVAKVMEEVRVYLGGKPIQINSWYRDPVTNRNVGGASKSRHLSGDAVDFVVIGIHPQEVNKRLENWWGNKGGLASASCFTHIDARGCKARWNYGF